MTAVPISVSEFWTRLVTPSVTSWSSASTSFVRWLMITPARFRSKKRTERRCGWQNSCVRCKARGEALQVPEGLHAEIAQHPSAAPAGVVRLRRAGEPVQDPGADEGGDDPPERLEVVLADPVVNRVLGERGREERGGS